MNPLAILVIAWVIAGIASAVVLAHTARRAPLDTDLWDGGEPPRR